MSVEEDALTLPKPTFRVLHVSYLLKRGVPVMWAEIGTTHRYIGCLMHLRWSIRWRCGLAPVQYAPDSGFRLGQYGRLATAPTRFQSQPPDKRINYHPQSGWFDHAPQRGAFLVKSPSRGNRPNKLLKELRGLESAPQGALLPGDGPKRA